MDHQISDVLSIVIERISILDGSYFDAEQLNKIYQKLGVGDALPTSNDFLDFSTLNYESIWLINRINNYLKSHQDETLEDLLKDHLKVMSVETDNGNDLI